MEPGLSGIDGPEIKTKGIASKITGIDKNEEHLKEAKSLGIIDDYMPFEEGVKSADLIIVAIPVDAARIILPSILDLLNDQQTVMDVGSTKNGIIKAIKTIRTVPDMLPLTRCGVLRIVDLKLQWQMPLPVELL